MQNLPKILVIVGPTASGKTALAIALARQSFSKKNLGGRAKKYSGGEIVSADSRQIYRELDIGSAKPSEESLRDIKHHFINEKNIDEIKI